MTSSRWSKRSCEHVEATGADAKYVQIVRTLVGDVRRQGTGTRLPAERVLAERFGVSRMTLRQALDELERGGWVERVHGSGTFVRRPVVTLGQALTSFTEDMGSRGLAPSSNLLGFDVVPAPADVAVSLGIAPGTEVVWVERLRFADGEPMCLEVSRFPLRFRQALEGGDLEGSVHDILRGHGVHIGSLLRRVGAQAATSRTARLLDLPEQSPTLEINDLFTDEERQPVQHARSYYRPDRYIVTVQVQAGADAGGQGRT
jgi:GntR family transcriptional regulator